MVRLPGLSKHQLNGLAQISKSRLAVRVVMATVFEPGDFVRLKTSAKGRVGVVCHVNPDSVTSVQVYWHRSELTRITDVYAPDALRLVPPDEVPEYAVALKMSLELGKPR